jgi:hypothetical protein
MRRRVVQIVRHHMLSPRGDAARARRLLARFGEELTFDLLDHKEADLLGKWGPGEPAPEDQLEQLAALREQVEAERDSPHRLSDLAVTGDDLLALGYTPGPELGAALRTLLAEVVDQPGRNTREALLRRAEELRRA